MLNKNIVRVRASNTGSPNLLQVSYDVANEYSMKSNLRLNFGSFSQRFNLKVNYNLPKQTLILPASIHIPRGHGYHIWSIGDNSYRLGPVIAILTADSSSNNKMFAGRPKFFAQLIEHAYQNGVYMFVVTPNGINPVTKRFTGYTYFNKKWVKVATPIPDVIYNRVPSRGYEASKRVRWAKSYITTQNIPFFNRHFLNKSELYKIFSKTHLTDLIPKTIKWSGNPNQLLSALNEFNIVYFKPVHSFAGHGIMRLENTKKGILLQMRDEKNNKPHYFNSFKEAYSLIRKKAKKTMVIQQGIDLAKYNNNIFDVRALSQRNISNEWQVIGMGCRLAGNGRITTHVPNGGSIAPANTVITQTFNQQAELIKHQLIKVATDVPQIIEQYYGYDFGIISMDIGIDKQGKLWLFEANAKPMEFDEEDTQYRSMQTLIEYSKHLTSIK